MGNVLNKFGVWLWVRRVRWEWDVAWGLWRLKCELRRRRALCKTGGHEYELWLNYKVWRSEFLEAAWDRWERDLPA